MPLGEMTRIHAPFICESPTRVQPSWIAPPDPPGWELRGTRRKDTWLYAVEREQQLGSELGKR